MAHPILAADDVRKSYGRVPALRGISLSVHRGELFGLLGPNGAGKTTLLSIIAGLLEPDAGAVKLNGETYTRSLRRKIGLGTQDLAVYPDLTARENLTFFGKLYGIERDALWKRADELLVAVGLMDRANDRAGTYSGGMKRRLNLAVAVVHSPELLLLDEPTTGVDPQSRKLIFDMVKQLNADGMAVIYTSHYMEEVQALCPRIAIIDHGEVRAIDTLPNLLATLDASIVLSLAVPPELPGLLRALPGVSSVQAHADGVEVRGPAMTTLLVEVGNAVRDAGLRPTRIAASEPTLEKVFLHLTGHALRD